MKIDKGHYIIIKVSIYQEDIMTINLYILMSDPSI
jgi:hypothetical protein